MNAPQTFEDWLKSLESDKSDWKDWEEAARAAWDARGEAVRTRLEDAAQDDVSLEEVARVADLVANTQPIWSGHLKAVCSALLAERVKTDALQAKFDEMATAASHAFDSRNEHFARADALEAAAKREEQARVMFIARLENMDKSGDKWISVTAVLAMLNDCDMLAARALPEKPQ